ncbi:ATP-binding protein [Acetomicrobium sp.]|uniref:ATP-binding protein n=1 Tax=Acetomicrobium sp. TaxID=1872099 RepID=UPI002871CFB7|nr:ATP-binding protein [Acetomicrobium sp.]MDR9770588.1 ATP-binding protein [Acetomicrobium sp.]
MIITVASGKGGTGKTTVAVNLALTLENILSVQILDCDVEEPNVHLFLHPEFKYSEIVTLPVPAVDQGKCVGCGKCSEICAFNAIIVLGNKVVIFSELCHGCGGCSRFCPEEAIYENHREIGGIKGGWAGQIGFIQGRLKIGNPLAPPVINAVKKRGKTSQADVAIIDAPPGTTCSVVASLKDCDFCILVTEPTPFGLNDLILAVDVARQLQIPFGVVINRADLGNKDILNYCEGEEIPILAQIPFDRRYAACYARGGRLVEEFPELKEAFKELWERICALAKYDPIDKGSHPLNLDGMRPKG